MMSNAGSDGPKTLQELVSDPDLIEEINELAASNEDVTWGANMVVIVLRTDDEIDRARRLGLRPVGTTLVIRRISLEGSIVNSDGVINKAVQIIKGG